MNIRRVRTACLAAALAIAGVSGAAMTKVDATAPTPGATTGTTSLTFNNASQTFAFDVVKAKGSGVLTVDTMDCCIAGDLWRVDLYTAQPASAANDVVGIGSGSTTQFSGAASAHVNKGCFQVSYSSGVDVFPASMDVRFQYVDNEGFGAFVTPRASGSCTS